MKLSIIVPIYNVEEYIARCALSLYNQTASVNDYEVVFVNDGTRDNSIQVLRNTINFDLAPNFHIVEKTNGGLSSARNYGVKNSCGDYVWFVDSDDWVDSDSVEFLLNLMKSSPDVICTTQMYSNIGDKECDKYNHAINFEGKGSEMFQYSPPICSQAHICKRCFLTENNLEFKEGILHEDSELIPRLLYVAKHVIATDRPLYHHFMREGSITHVINPHRYDSYFIMLDSLSDFYNTNVEDCDKSLFARMFAAQFYGLLSISRNASDEIRSKVSNYISHNKTLARVMKKSPDIQTKIIGFSISLRPSSAIKMADLFWKLKGNHGK